ncbi:MAG: DUF1326 domain-containing protein [Gammaproteobacteria bacterium]|nr:DUF1326 domain-containing protein [Gammaproteobacteria bacterium]
MDTQWKVTGTYFESCTCEVVCPCVFTGPPTDGECNALIGWHVDHGSFDGTPLDGFNAALFAHSPGHMLQTKWRVVLYVDERADAKQQEALTKIFSGGAGGHLAALSPLIGEVVGVKSAGIEYRSDGKQRSLSIPNVADMEIEALVGQDGKDVTLSNVPFTAVPGYPAVVCQSKRLNYRDHGFNVEVTKKNGFYSPFSYQA